ncbi:hypothetical protein [Sphingomonas bacterium]|uniref:hypothetical protein n=1 Tax=Sphingomonas bacterium TaxID=1895847 RepID=UPI0015765947|nr:hypothetical protein [Sphingomonas bacterium]
MYHDRHAFSFREADHLTRIHLRLGLEDLGFRVEECGSDLTIANERDPELGEGSPA